MNKNIKLAVAGAVLALSASAANAGIVIPAGDWSVDISGNVNAYANWYKLDGTATVNASGNAVASGQNSTLGFGNGLLPNFLSIGGSTRQNDLDVSFVISMQPGTSHRSALGETSNRTTEGINARQMFLTFGDKSWGSVKVGKDLGIFASDAILSDMTLLGVGAGSAGGGNTTLGRIGYGYIYADWKPQISYTTPNFNGFQATVGIAQAFTGSTYTSNSTTGNLTSSSLNASPAYEGKASYSFAANDVSGKIWVSGMAQKQGSYGVGYTNNDNVAYVGDIGANLNFAGFGLTGYYYGGNGVGTTGQFLDGYGKSATSTSSLSGRDSDGGYVQATYVLPTKTKLGVSWGISNLDLAAGETAATTASAAGVVGLLQKENEMWTAGIYHPLTKHLNLVAEYNHSRSTNQANQENKANSGSLGAILFF